MTDFVTKDGKVVSTLAEMATALQEMTDEDYSHHVTSENNDVANWIKDVHKNEELASAVSKATDKATVIELLNNTEESLSTSSEETQESVSESDSKEEGSDEGLQEPAKFPDEDYHQTNGAGKEDKQMNDSYKDKEEWDAAKEAHHPNEEVENPTENSSVASMAEKLNNESSSDSGISAEETSETATPDADLNLGTEHPLASETEDKPEMPSETTSQETKPAETETKEAVPKDLRPPIPGATLKDRLIPAIIGLVIGLVGGYFLAGLF